MSEDEVDAWLTADLDVAGIPVTLFAKMAAGGNLSSTAWTFRGIAHEQIALAQLTQKSSPEGLIYRLAADLGEPDFSFPDGLIPDLTDDILDLAVAVQWRNATKSQTESALAVLVASLDDGGSTPPPADEGLQFFFSWEKTSPARTVIGIDYNAPISLPDAPGILGGLFDRLSITGLAGAYASAGPGSSNWQSIPALGVFDVDTMASIPVSGPIDLSIEEGFSLLADLKGPGSSETIVLPITAGSHHTAHEAADDPAALGDASSGGATSKWFNVNKTFGPVHIQRVGVSWDDGAVGVGLDASISVQVLSLGLDGLEVSLNLKDIAKQDYLDSVDLSLSGLSLAYRSGPVEISGGFLKTQDASVSPPITEYAGDAVVQLKKFSLSALGSFAEFNGQPSLFAFALYEEPLGDPTDTGAFFITGLAAGFGYNQNLILPEQNQIQNFPLVAAAIDPSHVFPRGGKDSESLQQATQILAQYIPPSPGENWLAAGVRFTSWEMVRSFALLTVAFGTRTEIGLLGVSKLTLPTSVGNSGGAGTNLIGMIQMGLEAKIDPQSGLIAVTAVLTPNSWILSRDCKLQGGFAFYSWFSGDHSGDFVVTLGGYNPAFPIPSWYPREPRLGFNWQIDPNLVCKGGCYFALTPHMVMAGGRLEVVFQDGGLRAWFTAHANFLAEWQPFHYQADIGISVGCSYTFRILGIRATLSLSLGVDVTLQGPKFGGTARIDLYVVSVTIHFGQPASPPPALSFDEFVTALMPKAAPGPSTPSGQDVRTAPAATAGGAAPAQSQAIICTAKIARGAKPSRKSASSSATAFVTAGALRVDTSTAIPATVLARRAFQSPYQDTDVFSYSGDLYIRPMQGASPYSSTFAVTVVLEDAQDVTDEFDVVPSLANVPKALWSKYDGGLTAQSGHAPVLPDVPIGLSLSPKADTDKNIEPSPPIPLANLLKHVDFDIGVEWPGFDLPPVAGTGSPIAKIQDTIDSQAVRAIRNDVLNRLLQEGVSGLPDAIELGPQLVDHPDDYFLAAPRLANLGQVPQ